MIRALVLCSIALLVGLSACGDDAGGERSVVGVITDVQSTSITSIDSFTVHTDDDETLIFLVAPDARPEPEEGFVPGHLRSHAVEVEKVRVFYREEDGALLATRIVHGDPG